MGNNNFFHLSYLYNKDITIVLIFLYTLLLMPMIEFSGYRFPIFVLPIILIIIFKLYISYLFNYIKIDYLEIYLLSFLALLFIGDFIIADGLRTTDYFKIIIYFILLKYFLSIKPDQKSVSIIYNSIDWLFLIIAIIGILQFINVFNLKAFFLRYYIPESQVMSFTNVLTGMERVSGTLGNPNYFSSFSLLGFFWFLGRSQITNLKSLAGMVICFSALAVGQSRTSLISFITIVTIDIFFNFTMAKLFFVGFLACIVVYLALIYYETFFYFLAFIDDPDRVLNSFMARIDFWVEPIKILKENPVYLLFGFDHGHSGAYLYDSLIIEFLSKYGFIFTIYISFTYFFFFFKAPYNIKLLLIVPVISSITMPFFNHFQYMIFLLFLLSLSNIKSTV